MSNNSKEFAIVYNNTLGILQVYKVQLIHIKLSYDDPKFMQGSFIADRIYINTQIPVNVNSSNDSLLIRMYVRGNFAIVYLMNGEKIATNRTTRSS